MTHDRKDKADVIAWAKELASPDWCLSVPNVAKTALTQLVGMIEAAEPRTVTTEAELAALPVGTVMRAQFPHSPRQSTGEQQRDSIVMRAPEGASSSGGYGTTSGEGWLNMARWGAILTVISTPGVTL